MVIRTGDACTCMMECFTTSNVNHDDNCHLWLNDSFARHEAIWDAEYQRVMPKENIYTIHDDDEVPSIDEAVNELEYEALDAYLNGGADEYDWVKLPDGSWADVKSRITFRRTTVDGKDEWTEQWWDADPTPEAPADCICTPSKTYFCATCKVKRQSPTEPWEYDDWADHYVSGAYAGRCDHAFDRFILPNADQHPNVDIRISGNRMHTEGTTPDYGVYASHCWNPKSIHTFIPWMDYGLPTVGHRTVVSTLQAAWARAKCGEVVEFGCMGGHGRTGTMLACIAVLADPTLSGEDAVRHVRKVHCTKAVETSDQEWFVEWFAAHVRGEEFDKPMPRFAYEAAADYSYDYSAYPTVEPIAPYQTEILTDRTIERYANGKVVTTWTGGACSITYGTPLADETTGKALSPDAGSSTHLTLVASQKNNTAPGATANARRRNAKRKIKAQAQRRAKQKRNDHYIQRRSV